MIVATPHFPALQGAVQHAQAEQQSLVERLQCQYQFAELLCTLQPDRAADWRPLLAAAQTRVEAMAQAGAALPAMVAALEHELAPLAPAAKRYTVYALGHAHIDMNWMWSWPETVSVVGDTLGTVLRLMAEFPEFCFTQSQAAIYRIVAEYQPHLLPELAARVREGRWEVAASHWVEGDKNLAGGESLCRHLLEARRYLRELFGSVPPGMAIDWAPDTFGFPATMPTYLAQGGVRYCFLHRPGAHADRWPVAFRWRGPDGASVLVVNAMYGGYNGVFCPRMMLQRLTPWLRDSGLAVAPFLYGVGDHGGGPTRRDLRRARELATWPLFPTLQLAPATALFAALDPLAERLPEVTGQLNFIFTGCYTSQSLLKRCNRQGETRVEAAGRAAACATVATGAAWPGERLAEAWRHVLFSQFHDILPGSCVHDARTYSHGLFQQCMATAAQATSQALRALAERVPTLPAAGEPATALARDEQHSGFAGGAGHGSHLGQLSRADAAGDSPVRPFVVFHLDQGERREIVEVTVWENARTLDNQPYHYPAYAVTTPTGERLAAQVLEQGTYWGHDFSRLAFPATVAPFGYARYLVEPAAVAPAAPRGAWQLGPRELPARYSFHDLAPEGVENELLCVAIEPRSGGILRLTDKRTGQDLIAPAAPAPVLEYGLERPQGMSAWRVAHALRLEPLRCTALKRLSRGPYVAALEATFAFAASEVVLTYELRAGEPRLYLKLRVTWREFGSATTGVPFLRLALPLQLRQPVLTCEVPFGAQTHDFTAGEEVPGLTWGLVRGEHGGLLLLNQGQHAYALDGQTLRLNLLRACYEPDPMPEIGQHEFALALQPVAGDYSVAAASRAGQDFNRPLQALATGLHAGPLPPAGELLTVTPPEALVGTLKQADAEAAATILRLGNPGPAALTVTVAPGAALGRRVAAATLVDLHEEPLPGGELPVAAGTVTVPVPAHSLATLRLTWQPPSANA